MELPATPSKSKLPGRPRFCSLTTLLVLFALVAGENCMTRRVGYPPPPICVQLSKRRRPSPRLPAVPLPPRVCSLAMLLPGVLH